MNLTALIDQQIDRGTATNQMLVWNNTTKRFAVSVSLSGLTLNSPIIAGTVNAGGQTLTIGGAFTNGAVTLNSSQGTWQIPDDDSGAWTIIEGASNP